MTRLSRRAAPSVSNLWLWRAKRDGTNFDASFRQILGMESEIVWESEITPTLKKVVKTAFEDSHAN
jgi:hypothetical protein